MKQYVNVHAHSHGSLLDGNSRPSGANGYFRQAKLLNQPAATFTDHGTLHTVLDANDAAEEEGIKYFPGLEAYQARKTRFDKDPDERSGRARHEWDQRGPHHHGILAYNNVGYKNLIQLSSRSYTEGFFVKPRIDLELMAEHSEGLIGLSGCLSGMVQQALLRDDYDFALRTAGTIQDIFGRDNYFIEIMNHFIPEELQVHEGLIDIAKAIRAPIIASCDSHYTHKEEAHVHDVSLCIQTGARLEDEERFRFSGDHFYLKSYDEMNQLFPAEYLDNTMLIYDKHDLDISSLYDSYHFPAFPIPEGETELSFFTKLAREGAELRFGSNWESNAQIVERFEYEMNVIVQLGFINYFLIVSDIVRDAKDRKILVGAGRGSAAGSIVSYCLFITEVDPIKYDLAFERFLVYVSPEYEFNFPKVA